MITQPAHQLHRQGQKLQGLDNRSLRLIARPMALTNATLADACHVPHHSLVSYCCHPDHFPLIYQLYMPFCPVFSLCRVSFLDGPSAKRVAAWDGGTVLALSWASRGRSTLVLSEQNQTKSFFFFFFFLAGWQVVELYDLPARLFVSEFLLRQFVQALDSFFPALVVLHLVAGV